MTELKSKSPKRKSQKGFKNEAPISYEFVYYNDFWFNQKEYNKIENGLYLGTDVPIKDINIMDMLDVNHIISVKEEPVPENQRLPHIVYHHVEAGDFPDQDLISSFDYCYQLIDIAQKNDEVVYVNCGGGVSRSATIVIAYIMQKYRISYNDALKRVTKKRKVFPNEGFIEQLNLFERMQWFTDGSNKEYRRFLFKSLTYQLRSDGFTPLAKGSVDKEMERQMRFTYETNCVRIYFEKIASAERQAQSRGHSIEKGVTFYCYYCNTELFNEFNIIGDKDMICKNLFIEPLQTYCTQKDGQKNGFLKCPNCLHVFGTYNWLLYQCNCASHQRYKECLALRVFPLKISY